MIEPLKLIMRFVPNVSIMPVMRFVTFDPAFRRIAMPLHPDIWSGSRQTGCFGFKPQVYISTGLTSNGGVVSDLAATCLS